METSDKTHDADGEGRPCVLVVDDEEMVLRYTARALEGFYSVLTAPDIAAAEDLLGRHSVQVVLCDYRFKRGETGLDFLSRLQRLRPEVPRILMTGYPAKDVMLGAINECGVLHFIEKPLNTEVLRDVIGKAIARRQVAEGTGDGAARPAGGRDETPIRQAGLAAFLATLGVGGIFTVVLLLGALVFLVLYFLKAALGIDLLPGRHLGDFL